MSKWYEDENANAADRGGTRELYGVDDLAGGHGSLRSGDGADEVCR